MQQHGNLFWKTVPFFRILLPLIAGIIVQFYLQVNPFIFMVLFALGLIMILLTRLLSSSKLYVFRWIAGGGMNVIFFALGCSLVYHKDITNNSDWVGKNYTESNSVVVTI